MKSAQTSAELIASKYKDDGDSVVADYQALRFSKHVQLMRDHMGLAAGSNVLDVGCGTGALLVELAREGANVTGIDTFEEADGIDRQIVEARLREEGQAASVHQGNASSLPFDSASFDIVVTIGMLEHVPPEARKIVVPEIYRVVRPGGYLFLIAGPTDLTPYDQHIPGNPFANWMPREKKVASAIQSGRRQFLEIPWGISRQELRECLPQAEFRSLYAEYFAAGAGATGVRFSMNPLGFLVWLKRRFGLHKLFGMGAAVLYALHQEHCHILAIRKP